HISDGEGRIIDPDGPGSDHDRPGAVTEPVDLLAGCGRGDPACVAGARGQSAVQGAGQLQVDPRPAEVDVGGKPGVDRLALGRPEPHVHGDAGLPQALDASTSDPGV